MWTARVNCTCSVHSHYWQREVAALARRCWDWTNWSSCSCCLLRLLPFPHKSKSWTCVLNTWSSLPVSLAPRDSRGFWLRMDTIWLRHAVRSRLRFSCWCARNPHVWRAMCGTVERLWVPSPSWWSMVARHCNHRPSTTGTLFASLKDFTRVPHSIGKSEPGTVTVCSRISVTRHILWVGKHYTISYLICIHLQINAAIWMVCLPLDYQSRRQVRSPSIDAISILSHSLARISFARLSPFLVTKWSDLQSLTSVASVTLSSSAMERNLVCLSFSLLGIFSSLGDRLLDVGWTDYAKRAYYVTFDITDKLVNKQSNVFGITLGTIAHIYSRWELGNGWFSCLGGQPGCTNTTPQLRLVASITFASGALCWSFPLRAIQFSADELGRTVQVTSNTNGWKCYPGPIQYNSLYNGETYDARYFAFFVHLFCLTRSVLLRQVGLSLTITTNCGNQSWLHKLLQQSLGNELN